MIRCIVIGVVDVIKTRLIHTEAFRRDDDITIVILFVAEYYIFPSSSPEDKSVEYRFIQETYFRGRELESKIDIRSKKWMVIAENLCYRQRVYYKSHLFSKLSLPSEIDRMPPVIARRFNKLVDIFNNVDPRMTIAFPEENDIPHPIIEMPFEPKEKSDMETLCVNNIGLEDHFDLGEYYPFRLSDDDKVLVVIDANGEEMECMASRFRM